MSATPAPAAGPDAPPAALPTARPVPSLLVPHLGLLAVVIVWSAQATILKFGLRSVGPLGFTSLRFAIGGAVLLALGLATGERFRQRPPLRLLLPATVLGLVLNPLGFIIGVRLSTAVDVSVIMGLTPIAAAVLLLILARRPIPPRRLAGVVLGFAGLVAVVAATAHAGPSGSLALLGDLVALVSPICWAGYILVAARAARHSSAVVFLTWSTLLAEVVLLPLLLFEAAHQPERWLGAVPWLVLSGVVATGAGYAVYFWALPRVGVTETAVYMYIQPLLGALIGAFFLGEPFGPWQVGGAVAIIAAAYLGSWSRAGGKRRSVPAASRGPSAER